MADRQTQTVAPNSVDGMMQIMRSIHLQLSGLAGILAFLTQMWSRSPLDQSLYTGIIVGGGVYTILLFMDMLFQRIMAAHVAATREDKSSARASKYGRTNTEKPARTDQSASTPTADDASDDTPESTTGADTESPAPVASESLAAG